MTWNPMDTAPRDGSSFDVLCRSKDGIEVEVKKLHYGFKPMFKNDRTMILWGKENFLSPYLIPIGWRPIGQSLPPSSAETNIGEMIMAEVPAQAPASGELAELPVDLEELKKDADLGGKMQMQDVSIPYVYVLQANSPQVNPESEKYINDARPGMIYITALEKVFEGKQDGLPFVPCYFEARINEWISRDAGGGLVNTYMPDDPIMNRAKPSDRGIPILPNGHLLIQTQYHYMLVYVPTMQTWVQAVMPVKSTGLKNARQMNRQIATMCIPNTTIRAPRFLFKWTMKTVKQQKDTNVWSNFTFTQGDLCTKNLYEAAKNYALIAAKGILRKPQDEEQHTQLDEEVPF